MRFSPLQTEFRSILSCAGLVVYTMFAAAVSGCGGASAEMAPPPPPPPPPPDLSASAAPSVGPVNPTVTTASNTEATSGGETESDEASSPGLGLSGVGEGGGGTAPGGGLGSVGTLGHGAGSGTGQGYGAGAGGFSGPKGRVQAATASTSGSGLPAEVIQRIVKQNISQIRFCYEKAMSKNPSLQGKVAVSFTIGAKGAVMVANASDTNISDTEMITCVVGVVKKITFPEPENGGTVVVTYPFTFASDS